MNQWTYVHGEGDDPLGAPTYVETAYGVKFDPPVSQAEMGKMISKLGTCVRQYVESMVAANEKLKSGIPKDASQKALAGKLLEELLKRHQEPTIFSCIYPSQSCINHAFYSYLLSTREDHKSGT